jgi:hypothetical protein
MGELARIFKRKNKTLHGAAFSGVASESA